MKLLFSLGCCLILTIASQAQQEKKVQKKIQEENQISQHEKIIWAGTSIDLNEKSKETNHVPDAVMSSFRQFFPNQAIDNVRKFRGLYAITFSNNVFTTTLIYKANGTFVEARTVATDSTIPEAIKEKVRQTKQDSSAMGVVMIEKANKDKFYRYHFRKDNKDEFVVYDALGNEVQYDY